MSWRSPLSAVLQAVVLAVVLVASSRVAMAVDLVVFRNTHPLSHQGDTYLYVTPDGEGGDEIELAPLGGGPHQVTRFDVILGGTHEDVLIDLTVRFVLNDGPGGEPGSEIWSVTVPALTILGHIGGSLTTLEQIPVPHVVVPSSFTALVKIHYPSSPPVLVGIQAFDPPVVGSSDPTYVWGRDLLTLPPGEWVQVPPYPGTAANLGMAVRVTDRPAPAGLPFRRGDVTNDGIIDMADAVAFLEFLFVGASPAPSCFDACDADNDERLDLADAVVLVSSLFGVLPSALPPPHTACGTDLGPVGALDCQGTACP